jgi:hypothetical protein
MAISLRFATISLRIGRGAGSAMVDPRLWFSTDFLIAD